eukprot:CAMPEP_0206561516 /NCGR_PEP_ID=MMETSP0325_2-20121206/21654_1 /ASSEMBLY_ACC=CAM_ASM_000347 /TAXON_ID=2866 /ORGANISM="Crypthecodinium cohnii, Strain Seligo" /LENGTH=119 /DNA_ID=CAMNT_0054063459 /DNA_START=157 /DNA_END=516 /DNA_ORIENTATION=-
MELPLESRQICRPHGHRGCGSIAAAQLPTTISSYQFHPQSIPAQPVSTSGRSPVISCQPPTPCWMSRPALCSRLALASRGKDDACPTSGGGSKVGADQHLLSALLCSQFDARSELGSWG